MKMGVEQHLPRLFFFAMCLQTTLAVTYCPPLWTHYTLDKGISCYRYFGRRASWSEAEVTCAGYSTCEGEELAHLVSLSSPDEEMFVTEYRQSISGVFGGGDPGMWIGFSDKRKEGRWTWTDRSPANYTNWHRNEPSDSAQIENCARQMVPLLGLSVWIDTSCVEKHPFMCKMPAQ